MKYHAQSFPGMRTVLVLLFAVSLMILSGFAFVESDAETVYMTSLEWPPYSGKGLPHEGASIEIAKKAFNKAGYNFEVKFYPWKRTVQTARRDLNFIGYLPEYYSERIEKHFVFSEPIGTSPLGFMQHSDSPVEWETLSDLKGKRIGVVYGYVNTKEFDRMVANGELTVDYSVNDITNIRKMLRGRIDMAVIDRNVFRYLMNVIPEFDGKQSMLSFNRKLLENRKLYACFRNSPRGKRLCSEFNESLKKLEFERLQGRYIKNSLGD